MCVCVCVSTFQKSSLKTLGRIKPNFIRSPIGDGRTKVCSNGPGHMAKMAAMPIYGKKKIKIFSSETKRPTKLELGMFHRYLNII